MTIPQPRHINSIARLPQHATTPSAGRLAGWPSARRPLGGGQPRRSNRGYDLAVDTTERLVRVGDDLEHMCRRLFAIKREGTGRRSEKATTELARTILYWSIAVRRLAASGSTAWAEAQRRFPRDPDDPPLPEFEDPFAESSAQLDLVIAQLVDDMAIEALAYCELVLRVCMPILKPGDRIPPWWARFMAVLDASPDDVMTASARQLDITLAGARDRLIVHWDPDGWHVPGLASWGAVSLGRKHLKPERKAQALAKLRSVSDELEPWWPSDDFEQLLMTVTVFAGRLGRLQRKRVLDATAIAGIDAPPVSDTAEAALRLFALHADHLDALASRQT